jgi:5-methylcytosine-specific restriction protein A
MPAVEGHFEVTTFRFASPRSATLRLASPRRATRRSAAHRDAARRDATQRTAPPRNATPRNATYKEQTMPAVEGHFEVTTFRFASPCRAAQRDAAQRYASHRHAPHRVAPRRVAALRNVTSSLMPTRLPFHQPARLTTTARANSRQRGYTWRWQKARAIFLAQPKNAVCCVAGCNQPSEVVDHKQPHRGDYNLFWDETNWQAMCKRCHDIKTATEDRDA